MVTGSLINSLMGNSHNPVPTVGMGATICGWSDRDAVTVIAVSKDGKTVTVQDDTATRTDSNGMSDDQSYDYSPNPKGTVRVFTLRQNGRWIRKGDGMKSGTPLSLGHRDHHYDFSF